MATLAAGIGTSHVPSIGVAFDRCKQDTPAWKPLFDAYKPVQAWLSEEIDADVAIIVYNDHACDFSFDKYPTYALGVAETYAIADEGFGIRPLPPVKGDVAFSSHLCRHLIHEEEFDITVCREMAVEHGLLVPMNLCFDHVPDWNIKVVPLQVNVLQHPLPTATRCFKLGRALRRAVEAYPDDVEVVGIGLDSLDKIETDPQVLCDLTHHELMKAAGAEAVELIMWLTMRGALGCRVTQRHRHYYAPMTTGMGLIALEDAA